MDKAKPDLSKIGLAGLLLVSAELALALWVMARFDLDPAKQLGPAIFLAVPLFALHALLPLPWRRPFLLAATLALLLSIVGSSVFAIVLATSSVLLALCHLPIAFRWRVLLIIALVAGLAAAQLGWISAGRHLPGAIPILGAIFMFRLIIYLYDIRHEKPGQVTFSSRAAYFFLLPVPLFPFFPTLDYKVYLRCHYARPSFEIYQTGMLWISRGIVHLILYRVIYHFFSPPAEFVTDLGGVMAYCLSGYLIYLRVSGVFHIISGILRLFGYDLPETHRLYFFASGFSDYWRRINIYWKDFMAKIFFFPTFSALRSSPLGRPAKVALATVAVFAATTVLHSYQTFWLRGDPTIHETDLWFWGILGALVIANNLIDDRRPARLPSKKSWHFPSALALSLRVLGMFLLLCLLWALWSSHTLDNFLSVIGQAKNVDPGHLATFFAFCAAALTFGVLGQFLHHRGFHLFEERPRTARSVASTAIPLLVLAALWELHSSNSLPAPLAEKFDAVRIDQPNERDQIQEERSYYEILLGSGGQAVNFGASEEARVKDFDNPDIRGALYKANHGPVIAWGTRWTTNRWRMRDKDYPKEKPEGIYRIALSGASYVVGRGVPDGKNFESVAENFLNAAGDRFEILNFAISDTGTLQGLADLELRILDFDPDAFFLVCHNGEEDRNLRKLASVIASGDHDLHYPYIKDLAAKAGIKPGDSGADITRALRPYSAELLRWTYARIADTCRRHGVTPVWIYLPLTLSHQRISLADKGRPFPVEAGIHTLVLDNIYRDYPIDSVVVSEADSHPNELGHHLIARRLLEKLASEADALGLPPEIKNIQIPPLP